jgi:hypothetical protein
MRYEAPSVPRAIHRFEKRSGLRFPAAPRTFYGWRIVAACFVTHCLNVGTVFYSFGVLFHPLSERFGWSRAQISWGFSLAAVLGAFYATPRAEARPSTSSPRSAARRICAASSRIASLASAA